MSSLALQVVDAEGRPLLAREIALELNRRGFKVDRAQVNKSLHRPAQNTLIKDDSHRWSRPPRQSLDSPRSLAFRNVPPSGALQHPIPNPRPVAALTRTRVSIAVVIGLLIAAVVILFKFA